MINELKIEIELGIAAFSAVMTYWTSQALLVDVGIDLLIEFLVYVGYYIGARVAWRLSRDRVYRIVNKIKRVFKK